jgi:hypothetical protein
VSPRQRIRVSPPRRGSPLAACARTSALLAALALALLSPSLSAAPARGDTLAVDPLDAAAPVLWNGGVAWEDMQGVRAATPGSATVQRLVSYRALGFTYSYGLDAGVGSGDSGGALAYGWEEANDMTPPMGPGDTSIPRPPLPYESSISHRGLIGADGHATQLPDCSTQDQPPFFGSYLVSLANTTVAYLCAGTPPGTPPPSTQAIYPSYLALSGLATLASPAQTIAQATAPFQASGDYLAYGAGTTAPTRRIVVARGDTLAVSYEVPQPNESVRALALQADGTLVLLGAGTSVCPTPSRGDAGLSFPAEWLSPADPTPHQLGCFYDGALRPVGGQWVALAPGPGTHASLVLVTLATGATRALATFPNAGMAEPQLQQIATQPRIEPSADFDGRRLAWTQQTCAGTAVQLTPDVAAMSPGPLPSARCPIVLHTHGTLHPTAHGRVRVRMSCPLGCSVIDTLISGPRLIFREGPAYFSLPPSSRPTTEAFRLTRRQLAYLRSRRRVRVTISVETLGLGTGPFSKAAVNVTLAR